MAVDFPIQMLNERKAHSSLLALGAANVSGAPPIFRTWREWSFGYTLFERKVVIDRYIFPLHKTSFTSWKFILNFILESSEDVGNNKSFS